MRETRLNEWWCVSCTSQNNEKCETTLKLKDVVTVEMIKVDWDLCWGESRSTKPCVSPCKVASAGDGSYLVCATGAAAAVFTAIGSSSVLGTEWLFMCAFFYAFVNPLVADRNVMAA